MLLKKTIILFLAILVFFFESCSPRKSIGIKKINTYPNTFHFIVVTQGYNGKFYGDTGKAIYELNSEFAPAKKIWNNRSADSKNSRIFPVISGSHFLFKFIRSDGKNILLKIDLKKGVTEMLPFGNSFTFPASIEYFDGIEQPLLFKKDLLFIKETESIIIFDPINDAFRTVYSYMRHCPVFTSMDVVCIPQVREKVETGAKEQIATTSPDIYVIETIQSFTYTSWHTDEYICEIKVAYYPKDLMPIARINVLSVKRYRVASNEKLFDLTGYRLFITGTDRFGIPETLTLLFGEYPSSSQCNQSGINIGRIPMNRSFTMKNLLRGEYVVESEAVPIHLVSCKNCNDRISQKFCKDFVCKIDYNQRDALYKVIKTNGFLICFHNESCKRKGTDESITATFTDFISPNNRNVYVRIINSGDEMIAVSETNSGELIGTGLKNIYVFKIER